MPLYYFLNLDICVSNECNARESLRRIFDFIVKVIYHEKIHQPWKNANLIENPMAV